MTRFRPSPSMVVACIALVVAMGGTSYAALTITGKNVKNSSLTGKDIKNSSLTGKDVKNSSLTGSDVKNDKLSGSDILESSLGKVPSAANADKATSANSANTANSASSASNADKLDGKDSSDFGPKAFGYITSTGALDASRSKDIVASARNTGFPTGVYCIDVAFTPKNAVATVVRDAPSTPPLIIETKVPPNASSCQPGFEIQVVVSTTAGAFTDKAFMININ